MEFQEMQERQSREAYNEGLERVTQQLRQAREKEEQKGKGEDGCREVDDGREGRDEVEVEEGNHTPKTTGKRATPPPPPRVQTPVLTLTLANSLEWGLTKRRGRMKTFWQHLSR